MNNKDDYTKYAWIGLGAFVLIALIVGVTIKTRSSADGKSTSTNTPITQKVPTYKFLVCDGEPFEIKVPPNKVIASASVKYGRWDNICSPTAATISPKFKVYDLPDLLNKNKYNVTGKMSDIVSDDPYPGVAKTWEVTVTTKNNPTFTTTPIN